jgi:hypothetical protein
MQRLSDWSSPSRRSSRQTRASTASVKDPLATETEIQQRNLDCKPKIDINDSNSIYKDASCRARKLTRNVVEYEEGAAHSILESVEQNQVTSIEEDNLNPDVNNRQVKDNAEHAILTDSENTQLKSEETSITSDLDANDLCSIVHPCFDDAVQGHIQTMANELIDDVRHEASDQVSKLDNKELGTFSMSCCDGKVTVDGSHHARKSCNIQSEASACDTKASLQDPIPDIFVETSAPEQRELDGHNIDSDVSSCKVDSDMYIESQENATFAMPLLKSTDEPKMRATTAAGE